MLTSSPPHASVHQTYLYRDFSPVVPYCVSVARIPSRFHGNEQSHARSARDRNKSLEGMNIER